jgi:hypothetical protein
MQIPVQTPSGMKIQCTTESIKKKHTWRNRYDLFMFAVMSFACSWLLDFSSVVQT